MALLLWPSKCRLHLLKGLLLPLLRSRFVYMLLIIMRRVELSKAERIKSETSCPVCDNYLDSFLQTFKLVHGSSDQPHSALCAVMYRRPEGPMERGPDLNIGHSQMARRTSLMAGKPNVQKPKWPEGQMMSWSPDSYHPTYKLVRAHSKKGCALVHYMAARASTTWEAMRESQSSRMNVVCGFN